ncbi:glutamate-rich protein 2 isoform X2 [Misgurnus anguillicaudatus]|uniref:glutamate-rich protein 2 isoform X2 n=1 Tax=Misgurnus anguillicaudatus TaxID=75329 RepID=UPI003CCFDA5D
MASADFIHSSYKSCYISLNDQEIVCSVLEGHQKWHQRSTRGSFGKRISRVETKATETKTRWKSRGTKSFNKLGHIKSHSQCTKLQEATESKIHWKNRETRFFYKLRYNKSYTRSGGYNATKAPSFKNVTTHGHKLPKQVPPVMTEQQTTSEVKLDSGHELQIHPHVVLCDPDPRVEEREEEESEEHETAEGHVPLELFAEFLQAVMTKNYQLSKKLCQMILIYEPQNSEAKNFLPLIEEKLLIETEECLENNDDESDTSDDDDDEEEDDSSDDEDVDDNESSDSCDTDEESTDSTDDTSSSA